MTLRRLLAHPSARFVQIAANLGFAVGFVWNTVHQHTAISFTLAFLVMTAVNVIITDARRANDR